MYSFKFLTSNNSSATGFTLAEVLITLGVIGVVAAITLPSVIASYQKKELESRFKKTVSVISQAVQRMSVDTPNINKQYCPSQAAMFIPDFTNYFRTGIEKTTDTGNLKTLGYNVSAFYQSSGDVLFNSDGHKQGAFLLNDGMMLGFSGCWWESTYIDFMVDTNGRKGPNRLGYDIFYFQIDDYNRVLPLGGGAVYPYTETYGQATEANMKDCCNFQASGTCRIPQDGGTTCAAYAIRNVSPTDSSKRYWESLP